ncbi:MAG: hypothetical protein JWM95_4430 [Gemmatimonadetes bacterium]|nr:hypothetical protein [Gemmatimonadota bacterium]
MPSSSIRISALSLLSVIALAGCATLQPAGDPPAPRRFSSISEAEMALTEEGGGVPHVRLYVPGAAFSAMPYVDAQIRVTEDAYVMVIAVDRDHRVRVVFPESPDESGFVSHESAVHAKRFFAGFGSRFSYASAGYGVQRGTAGNMVAIASDRPLQFERLVDADGDWNEYALERLVFTGNATSTAYSLGHLLTLTGQHFSMDRANFIGGPTASYSMASQGSCSSQYADNMLGGGFGGFGNEDVSNGFGFSTAMPIGVTYVAYNGVVYAQYRFVTRCGTAYYRSVPVGPAPMAPVPAPRDTTKKDSTATAPAGALRYNWRIAEGDGSGVGAATRLLEKAPVGRTSGSGFRIPQVGLRDGSEPGSPVQAGGIRFRSPAEVGNDRPTRGARARDGSWPGTNGRRDENNPNAGSARTGRDYQSVREERQQGAARGDAGNPASTRATPAQPRAEQPVQSAPPVSHPQGEPRQAGAPIAAAP